MNAASAMSPGKMHFRKSRQNAQVHSENRGTAIHNTDVYSP
jgi:hypothetical protein